MGRECGPSCAGRAIWLGIGGGFWDACASPHTFMASWEYKVITSGRGGFASPALLEKFLNDLGRDEWEIIEFRSAPDNALAFNGLARRTTQRDWTLEDAAAAAAKAEAEKLRAEFAAKFQAATTTPAATAGGDERSASFLEERTSPDDGFRKPVDTSRDGEPDAPEEEGEKDEWEQLESEDELPSFFDALKPHMRRNQRGPGMSVGTDYLAKKWGLAEEDIKGALVECGLQIPADENAKPVYAEYDGDLYWVNINRRGEVWINTREKPRPVFRVVQAAKFTPEATEEAKPAAPAAVAPEDGEAKPEAPRHQRHEPRAAAPTESAAPAEAAPTTPGAPLPAGVDLLGKIRPMMRRNRRGPGGSGSVTFLARALKCSEADLTTAFAGLGLALAATPNAKPTEVEIAGAIWWLNQDSRGGVWINGREKREGDAARPAGAPETAGDAPAAPSATAEPAAPVAEVAPLTTDAPAATAAPVETPAAPVVPAEVAPLDAPAAAPAVAEAVASTASASGPGVFPAARLLMKETRTGGLAGKVDRLASELGKSAEEFVAALVAAGLKVPEKSREKPVFVEHAGEIFWFNVNAKGELWLNAKASKFADGENAGEGDDGSGRRPRRGGRGRGGKGDSSGPDAADGAEAPTAESSSTPEPQA